MREPAAVLALGGPPCAPVPSRPMQDQPLRYTTVSFLSDYGRVDEFVGVVHSVLHALAPGVLVVDITHDIAPFDVRAGGFALARSAQYLCPGVVLAVVDPGVGTPRRGVAVEVGDGASVLVGPDNGLLAPAVAFVGGATRAVALDDPTFHLPAPGPTFDGRDVFAPAAAHLCLGVDLAELGTEIDPSSLLPATMGVSRIDGGRLLTEVLWVDRYGNAQLNVGPDDLDALGSHFELVAHGRTSTVARATTFADLPPGGVGLVVDSYGLVAVAARQASAAETLAVDAGDEVALRPTAAPAGASGGAAGGPEVRVELSMRPEAAHPDGAAHEELT